MCDILPSKLLSNRLDLIVSKMVFVWLQMDFGEFGAKIDTILNVLTRSNEKIKHSVKKSTKTKRYGKRRKYVGWLLKTRIATVNALLFSILLCSCIWGDLHAIRYAMKSHDHLITANTNWRTFLCISNELRTDTPDKRDPKQNSCDCNVHVQLVPVPVSVSGTSANADIQSWVRASEMRAEHRSSSLLVIGVVRSVFVGTVIMNRYTTIYLTCIIGFQYGRCSLQFLYCYAPVFILHLYRSRCVYTGVCVCASFFSYKILFFYSVFDFVFGFFRSANTHSTQKM